MALPVWIFAAHVAGLYDRDGSAPITRTADDLVGVFARRHRSAPGSSLRVWLTHAVARTRLRMVSLLGAGDRVHRDGPAVARALCRRSSSYFQNTIIVGAGDVGQLVARKLLQHPEYGINLVGFVDTQPAASCGRTSSS